MQIIEVEDKTGFYLVSGVNSDGETFTEEVDIYKLAADMTENEQFPYSPGTSREEHWSLIMLGILAGLVGERNAEEVAEPEVTACATA